MAESYPRLHEQVRAAVANTSASAEFADLFPAALATTGRPWGYQGDEAQSLVTQMAGWLTGVIDGATFEQRLEVEARAKAEADAKRTGFA